MCNFTEAMEAPRTAVKARLVVKIDGESEDWCFPVEVEMVKWSQRPGDRMALTITGTVLEAGCS